MLDSNTGSGAGGKCKTCLISFDTSAEYREHYRYNNDTQPQLFSLSFLHLSLFLTSIYRSDWHRINLKRKMKNLPLAVSHIEFQSHPIEYWDVDIVTSPI